MALNLSKLPLASIGGTLVILLFCVFTLASISQYPGPFSPMDNWLSDLGTPVKNPSGDLFFNVGCILTGICMLVLMAGLNIWKVEGLQKKVLALGRICGAVSAVGLMLIGIFYEGTAYHSTLALIFFLFLFLFLVFTNAAIWKHMKYNRWIRYYAIVAIVLDVVFIYTFFAYEHAPAWEWLAVFSALLWVAMLAYNILKLNA
jgi:hypothetical membrane protein